MTGSVNVTYGVLWASLAVAVAGFAVAAGIRWWVDWRRGDGPPPLPVGKVAVWPYYVVDLVWMGFLVLTYGALGLSNARAAAGPGTPVIGVQGLVQAMGFQLVLAGMTVVVMVWRVRPVEWLGLRWRGWPRVLWLGPVGVLAMWAANVLMYQAGYFKWMESLGVEQVQESVRLLHEAVDPLVVGMMALAAVVVAPVCEEVMFRGYLYPVAKRFGGAWVGAFASALVFAVAHGGLATLLPLFLFGLLLVWVYEWTGSLWAPVALHFCFNGATVLVQLAARMSGYQLPETL